MDVTDPTLTPGSGAQRRRDPRCIKVSQVISRIGDKWSVLVIMQLAFRGFRFNELKRAVDGISQRMLTLTVRNLERDGLITRRVTPAIPPYVEYELTEMGRALAQPVKALGDWALAHSDAISKAQAEFDANALE